jgi:putative ABC transport system permease protein
VKKQNADDALLIRGRFPELATIAPLKFVEADVRAEGQQGVAQVVGTNPAYEDIVGFHVVEGRFVTPFDLQWAKNVCILGSEIKQELFGYRDALSRTIRVGEQVFTVVGVMEAKHIEEGKTATIKVRNLNRDVYIPITTALKRFPQTEDSSAVDEIIVHVARAEELAPAADRIRSVVAEKHRGVEDFEVMIPEELLAQAQKTQRLFSIVMGSIAGLSLLVGGIGIMNIMLANVSERTREIGIRRAIGATKSAIVVQFVIETVLICLAGGLLGILLGIGMAKVVTLYAGWQTALSPAGILIAFGMSASIGLAFGLLPARQAAQLHPVQALRHE